MYLLSWSSFQYAQVQMLYSHIFPCTRYYMWLHHKSYILDCKFMVKINKICIIKQIYSWEKRLRVVQSGKEAHLCTHRYAPGSTRIQSLLYLLSPFTALPTCKKISEHLKNTWCTSAQKWGVAPLSNGAGEEEGKNQSTNWSDNTDLLGCPRSTYSIEIGRRKQNKYFFKLHCNKMSCPMARSGQSHTNQVQIRIHR